MLSRRVCPAAGAWRSCVAHVFSFLLDLLPHCKLGIAVSLIVDLSFSPLKLCQFLLHIFQCYDVKHVSLLYLPDGSAFYHYEIALSLLVTYFLF